MQAQSQSQRTPQYAPAIPPAHAPTDAHAAVDLYPDALRIAAKSLARADWLLDAPDKELTGRQVRELGACAATLITVAQRLEDQRDASAQAEIEAELARRHGR